MEKYYLMPCARQGRKSFGCNAVVEIRDDGTRVLYSYLTKIAKITPDGLLVRLCDDDEMCSSQTTMRHIVAFCINNDLPFITKKAWNEMPQMKDL